MSPSDRGLLAGLLTFLLVLPPMCAYGFWVAPYLGIPVVSTGEPGPALTVAVVAGALVPLFALPAAVALGVRRWALNREPVYRDSPVTEADIVVFR